MASGMYIGGGGGGFGGSPTAPVLPAIPGRPNQPQSQPGTPPQPGSVLGAQSVRPTGPSSGFDPQYLQNLATAIGGLFSRPQGNLSFNPLGNLSDVASPGLGFGNAPSPGIPSTMLQDALNGLSFMFNRPTPVNGSPGMSTAPAPINTPNKPKGPQRGILQ